MKKLLLILLVSLIGLPNYAQDISGKWNGILKVQGTQLRLVFNIAKSDKGYSSTIDSPDQGANGIPVTSISFDKSMLKLEVQSLGIQYEGTLDKDNNIVGTFKQGGLSLPLNLSRKESKKEKIVRPQNPVKPYPYKSEDIKFNNTKDNIELAGTLTLPKGEGKFPAVILISGSGPQNRDEKIFGHKPFLVLADYLTRRGIAVLRFDDRGTAKSTGDFKAATTYDFATDVESALDYLRNRKEINKKKIGLLGHSEGGMVAPLVASRSENVDFVVLLAGPALRGDKLLLLQKYKIERMQGVSETVAKYNGKIFAGVYELILDEKLSSEELGVKLKSYFKEKLSVIEDKELKKIVGKLTNKWMVEFLRFNTAKYLKKVNCPVFAIYGGKDLQVPSKENMEVIDVLINESGKGNISSKELEGLNHLFQECKTGMVSEYSQIEQTISPVALEEIYSWIMKQVK